MKNSESVETTARKIYVRDDVQTRTGFDTHKSALEYANTLINPNCMGTRERDDMRVRISFRQRTGLYDVVVKLAQEVK